MITRLKLEYDGSRFSGWARQPGLRTVQGVLETALRSVLGEQDHEGEPLQLTVAGRTDKGVHAWEQVASYRHEPVAPGRLQMLLPDDVSVLCCERAEEDFDARRNALSRTYCYRVLARRRPSVFMAGTALWVARPLEVSSLRECAQALRGRHDFTAFTPTVTDHVRFERDVFDAHWEVDGELLQFWIEADTFMRHMNRVLVGTMLEVASGRRSIESFEDLLRGAPREQSGPTAPPHGLALASVSYPPRA